jgi:hypothetical protein
VLPADNGGPAQGENLSVLGVEVIDQSGGIGVAYIALQAIGGFAERRAYFGLFGLSDRGSAGLVHSQYFPHDSLIPLTPADHCDGRPVVLFKHYSRLKLNG